jgi:4-alpha-glucanotransferase
MTASDSHHHAATTRRAGLLLPLFSMVSSRSWGIGDIADLAAIAPWLQAAHLRALQILPVNDMATGQSSPYSALSAMATDPIYLAVDRVPEVAADHVTLDADERARLEAVRLLPRVDYVSVRALKMGVLGRAFARFVDHEWRRETPAAHALRAFIDAEAWWLADYALFRVLHDVYDARPWWEWPEALAARAPEALDAARLAHAHALLFTQWLQWHAQSQWDEARARLAPIAIIGDLPFMVSTDSADVWANQQLFSRDATVGTPPDAFSATGQDWGLPVYRWDEMARADFGWLRARGRRAAEMFDAYRVDHLVGFYRTYNRPVDGGEPYFVPAEEHEQRWLGEKVLEVFRSAGADIIAEDLGTIPDFVRESLDRLGVPGYRVLRWERDWHAPGHPFREPATYPHASLATTGTHDTDMLAAWWDGAPYDERTALLALPALAWRGFSPDEPFSDRLRDALIELMMHAASDLVILPLQDVFGWRDRINVPASVGEQNWSWVSPIRVDALHQHDEARARADALRGLIEASGRAGL